MTGTERKVFQKYYPPDFDPSKIPKAKGSRNRQFVQRVMAPFNLQCNTCNEYIYKGKKFNMRRETAEGEFYLGLKIFRFYFRCPNCLAEITFKTDLENCDYQMEHGATRLFEAFKLYQDKQREKDEKEEADMKNPMKMLEKRTKMSRAEMEALGKLEELRELNRRHASINTDQVIQKNCLSSVAEMIQQQEEEDEALVRSLFGKDDSGKTVRRLQEENDEEVDEKPNLDAKSSDFRVNSRDLDVPCTSSNNSKIDSSKPTQKQLLQNVIILKKPKSDNSQPINSALFGLMDYGNDSGEEEN